MSNVSLKKKVSLIMRRHLPYLLIVVLALAVVTFLAPAWPYVAFWALVFWISCPDHNMLSPSCGSITLGFVADRAMAIALFAYLVWLTWRVCRLANKN